MEGNLQVINGRRCRERNHHPSRCGRVGEAAVDKSRLASSSQPRRRGERKGGGGARERNKGGGRWCEPPSLYPSPTSPTNFFSSPTPSLPSRARSAASLDPPPPAPLVRTLTPVSLRLRVSVGRRAALTTDSPRASARARVSSSSVVVPEFRPAGAVVDRRRRRFRRSWIPRRSLPRRRVLALRPVSCVVVAAGRLIGRKVAVVGDGLAPGFSRSGGFLWIARLVCGGCQGWVGWLMRRWLGQTSRHPPCFCSWSIFMFFFLVIRLMMVGVIIM